MKLINISYIVVFAFHVHVLQTYVFFKVQVSQRNYIYIITGYCTVYSKYIQYKEAEFTVPTYLR